MQLNNGSLFLFRLFGVNVFVHWSWALVGAFEVYYNTTRDIAPGHIAHGLPFCIAQYLCLFFIVLLHEFGHALACKSVGGVADRITLWPLGGVAYVQPPQRPGALLWSIAAGPLVNVILLPLTIGPLFLFSFLRLSRTTPAFDFLFELAFINAVLLVFNMLPIYPLDGGQILRALAWFLFGRSRSLLIAAAIGIAGSVGLALVALYLNSLWTALIAFYMGSRAFNAIKIANAQRRIESLPRHIDAACPSCKESPPAGKFWKCPCGATFDTFANSAQCPACAKTFTATKCILCGKTSPRPLWHSTGGFTVTLNEPLAPVPTT
jgi:Zn-dependent protease